VTSLETPQLRQWRNDQSEMYSAEDRNQFQQLLKAIAFLEEPAEELDEKPVSERAVTPKTRQEFFKEQEKKLNRIARIIDGVRQILRPFLGKEPNNFVNLADKKLKVAYNIALGFYGAHKQVTSLRELSLDYLKARRLALTALKQQLKCRCYTYPSRIRVNNHGATCAASFTHKGISKSVQLGEFDKYLPPLADAQDCIGETKEDVALRLGIAINHVQYSHLCHLGICANPDHGVFEHYSDNQIRKRCHLWGRCVCKLSPSCILDCHPPDFIEEVLQGVGLELPRMMNARPVKRKRTEYSEPEVQTKRKAAKISPPPSDSQAAPDSKKE